MWQQTEINSWCRASAAMKPPHSWWQIWWQIRGFEGTSGDANSLCFSNLLIHNFESLSLRQ